MEEWKLPGLRRIVLDVLKVHEPKITDISMKLCALDKVEGVNISVYEIDKQTENIKITIEGNDIDYKPIKEIIESMNGVIHSIDEVAAGKTIIEKVITPQDR
jgi:hypothetical protein